MATASSITAAGIGAGRLEVDAALELALDDTRPLADVYVRDNLADTGLVPSSAPWWASPDIWVRHNAHEPIPALAWSTEPPHQDPVRGQDNAVFCRVRNASAVATATNVYVRAMVAHWPGLEFVYPHDFIPDVPPGSVVPSLPMNLGTYLIGEQRIDALPPNGDAIVKLNWDAALIPPAFVQGAARSRRSGIRACCSRSLRTTARHASCCHPMWPATATSRSATSRSSTG